MSIKSVHPDYEDYKATAEFVETFYEGETSVKKKGDKLLPRLSGQSDIKYKAYRDRAIVFGVVPRTVSALIATAFRKEPKFFLPEKMKYMLDDCTNTGVPLNSFAMQLLQEILVTGRAGILVDMPEDGGNPFFVLYDGDDIRNWSTEPGQEFVVLENSSLERDKDDKFTLVEKEGWRELSLNGEKYEVNIWEENDKGEPFIASTETPIRFNSPLNFIPFVPVSTYGADFETTTSPLLGLAQLSHKSYMISADRMNAIHLIAVPTPWISAPVDKDEFGALELGPDACLLLPENSKAAFLEFTGQGLNAVEKAEQDLLDMMGALGARLLMGQKSSSEKATGVRDRSEIANSVLTSVLTSIEVALTRALKIASYWQGQNEAETYCKFNKELTSVNVDANTINALVTAYQNNSIDLDTLFHNLYEGGYIAPDTDFESFSANIEERMSEIKTATEPQPVVNTTQGVDNVEKV